MGSNTGVCWAARGGSLLWPWAMGLAKGVRVCCMFCQCVRGLGLLSRYGVRVCLHIWVSLILGLGLAECVRVPLGFLPRPWAL